MSSSLDLWLLRGFNVIIILVSINHHPHVLLLLRGIYPMRLRLRGWSVDLNVPRVLDPSNGPRLLLLAGLHLHPLILVLTGKLLMGNRACKNLLWVLLLEGGVVTCRVQDSERGCESCGGFIIGQGFLIEWLLMLGNGRVENFGRITVGLIADGLYHVLLISWFLRD